MTKPNDAEPTPVHRQIDYRAWEEVWLATTTSIFNGPVRRPMRLALQDAIDNIKGP